MKGLVVILCCIALCACAAAPEQTAAPTAAAPAEPANTPLPQTTATTAPSPTPASSPTPEPLSAFIIPDITVVDEQGGDEIRTWIATAFEGTSFLILNAHPGAGFKVSMVMNFSNDSNGISYDPIWAYAGAEHLYDGKLVNYERQFDSDPTYPLAFKLVKDIGYVYLYGRGTVTTQDGQSVSLGANDSVETWLPKLSSTVQLQREAATQALGWLAKSEAEKEKAVTALLQALNDPAMPVRRDAAEALGKLGMAQAATPLFERLADPDGWVADVAAEALQTGLATGLSADQAASLVKDLQNADPAMRLRAIRVLGATKSPMAFEPLSDLTGDESADIKAETAKALGNLGDRRALQPLLDLLKNETPAVRSGAALGLGALGDPAALAELIAALADSEWEVRIAVAQALGMLGDPSAIQPLEDALAKAEYTNEKDAITEALNKLKGQ
jgi:HEAT repeat protein